MPEADDRRSQPVQELRDGGLVSGASTEGLCLSVCEPTLTCVTILPYLDYSYVAIVDIRETNEQEEEGAVLGALHVPYAMIAESLKPRGLLHQTGVAKKLIFICTFGERSAMAVQLAQAVGLDRARHLHGGLAEWRARNQNLVRFPKTSRIGVGV